MLSKTEKLTPVVSLVSVQHLKHRAWLAQCQFKVTGCMRFRVYLRHATLMCWHIKSWLESGSVTTDLTTTAAQLYKSLKSNIKFYWQKKTKNKTKLKN